MLVVGHRHVPAQVAGTRIERDQMRIRAAVVHRISQNRHATIYFSAAQAQIAGDLFAVTPQRASCAGIHRNHTVRRLGDKHHAIDNDWRRGKRIQFVNLPHPGDPQLAYVSRVDLVERRVTGACVVA